MLFTFEGGAWNGWHSLNGPSLNIWNTETSLAACLSNSTCASVEIPLFHLFSVRMRCALFDTACSWPSVCPCLAVSLTHLTHLTYLAHLTHTCHLSHTRHLTHLAFNTWFSLLCSNSAPCHVCASHLPGPMSTFPWSFASARAPLKIGPMAMEECPVSSCARRTKNT